MSRVPPRRTPNRLKPRLTLTGAPPRPARAPPRLAQAPPGPTVRRVRANQDGGSVRQGPTRCFRAWPDCLSWPRHPWSRAEQSQAPTPRTSRGRMPRTSRGRMPRTSRGRTPRTDQSLVPPTLSTPGPGPRVWTLLQRRKPAGLRRAQRRKPVRQPPRHGRPLRRLLSLARPARRSSQPRRGPGRVRTVRADRPGRARLARPARPHPAPGQPGTPAWQVEESARTPAPARIPAPPRDPASARDPAPARGLAPDPRRSAPVPGTAPREPAPESRHPARRRLERRLESRRPERRRLGSRGRRRRRAERPTSRRSRPRGGFAGVSCCGRA